jgi:hypothetical protein
MTITTSLTVVLSIITVLHLLITFGLVRRLRVHTDLLNQLLDDTKRTLPTGTPIPAFTASTVDDVPLSDSDLAHPAAIALLAVNCPHCRTNLPDFVAYVRSAGYPRDHVLAVVTTSDGITDPADRDTMIDALTPVATVICETGPRGPVAEAFQTQGFPTFYLTDTHAAISASSHAVRQLPDTTVLIPHTDNPRNPTSAGSIPGIELPSAPV